MKRRDFITSSSLALTLPLFPAWEGYSADSIIPSELLAITGEGKNIMIKKTDIADLKKSLKGTLLLPDDNGYNIARLVRNSIIDKKPALIAQCIDETDGCEFVIESDDAQEVMLEFGKHSDEEHGIWYSDESLKQIVQNKYNIK